MLRVEAKSREIISFRGRFFAQGEMEISFGEIDLGIQAANRRRRDPVSRGRVEVARIERLQPGVVGIQRPQRRIFLRQGNKRRRTEKQDKKQSDKSDGARWRVAAIIPKSQRQQRGTDRAPRRGDNAPSQKPSAATPCGARPPPRSSARAGYRQQATAAREAPGPRPGQSLRREG